MTSQVENMFLFSNIVLDVICKIIVFMLSVKLLIECSRN